MAHYTGDGLALLPPELTSIIYSYVYSQDFILRVAPSEINNLQQCAWQKRHTKHGKTWPKPLLKVLIDGMLVDRLLFTMLS